MIHGLGYKPYTLQLASKQTSWFRAVNCKICNRALDVSPGVFLLRAAQYRKNDLQSIFAIYAEINLMERTHPFLYI